MIILDTNVLSELMRPAPFEAVLAWVTAHPATSLFTTAITQAEIMLGVTLIPEGRRRVALFAATEGMFQINFAGRILPFDSAAAREFAPIAADRRRQGRPVTDLDAQIAAIARSRGAAVATRNVADFANCGLDVINPWE